MSILSFDIQRLNRVPTLSEYGTAKKEFEKMEIGFDVGEKCGDKTVIMLVDKDTLLHMYWKSIPKDDKRSIKVGNKLEPPFDTL
jgi:hypothetical protein